MISDIYNSDEILFPNGSRKGKSKKEIQSEIKAIKSSKKTKGNNKQQNHNPHKISSNAKQKYLKDKREVEKWDRYNELQNLSKKWNPPPKRNTKQFINKDTVEAQSNFINVKQGYFNEGKYKMVDVKNTPLDYLEWVYKNVQLNLSEQTLVKKYIDKKSDVE